MALDGTSSVKWISPSLVILSSPSRSINHWAKHISPCFVKMLHVIRKWYHKHHTIEVFGAIMHVEFLETNIYDLETSQEPCWSNSTVTMNWSTRFEVVAQHSSLWLRNSLNIPKPLTADLQANFKIKTGRNSIVLGKLKAPRVDHSEFSQKLLLTFWFWTQYCNIFYQVLQRVALRYMTLEYSMLYSILLYNMLYV